MVKIIKVCPDCKIKNFKWRTEFSKSQKLPSKIFCGVKIIFWTVIRLQAVKSEIYTEKSSKYTYKYIWSHSLSYLCYVDWFIFFLSFFQFIRMSLHTQYNLNILIRMQAEKPCHFTKWIFLSLLHTSWFSNVATYTCLVSFFASQSLIFLRLCFYRLFSDCISFENEQLVDGTFFIHLNWYITLGIGLIRHFMYVWKHLIFIQKLMQ